LWLCRQGSFRCGTGNEFSVFNILTRKQLELKDRSLLFMDNRDFTCDGYVDTSQFNHNLFKYLKSNVVNNITILFHNSTFVKPRYIEEYKKALYVWNKRNNR